MKTFLTYLDETSQYDALGTYATGGASTGPGLGQYVGMADLNAADEKEIKKSDLDQVEKYADRIFASLGIDVEFTRHFLDRANDKRNVKQITPAELTRLFKQSYKKYGKKIAQLGPDAEAVINDMKTDINMPFVLNLKGGELELIAKTVMRKKNFQTSGPKMSFENYINEKRAKQAVSQGKVQKLVTAHGLKFKGKVYKEIDMELKDIDNNTKMVTFNIIHPREIFGNEVKLAFKVLSRGPFMATDTSKINEAPRIPRKKGQPAGSDSHSDLYTDENPKGTIHGLKFATVKDAKASVSKIEGSGKKHAHKIQAAIAMEQRAKEMGKTSEAAVYRTYIEKMKKITKQKNEAPETNIAKVRDQHKNDDEKLKISKDRELDRARTQDTVKKNLTTEKFNKGE